MSLHRIETDRAVYNLSVDGDTIRKLEVDFKGSGPDMLGFFLDLKGDLMPELTKILPSFKAVYEVSEDPMDLVDNKPLMPRPASPVMFGPVQEKLRQALALLRSQASAEQEFKDVLSSYRIVGAERQCTCSSVQIIVRQEAVDGSQSHFWRCLKCKVEVPTKYTDISEKNVILLLKEKA